MFNFIKIKNSYYRIMAQVKKEILTILKDKKSRVILVAPVIVQCIIFGYGASYHLEHIPFTFLSNDNSALAHELKNTLINTPKFELTENCLDLSCLENSISNQKSIVAIYLDSNFKNTHQVNVITDARNTASANTCLAYLNQIVTSLNLKLYQNDNLALVSNFLFNENNYTIYTVLIGMCLALSIIQILLLSALSVTREKEDGTYDMMIMTPVRPLELLIGKALPPIVIACIQSLVIIIICYYYFKIPMRGSLIDVLLQIVIFSFTVVGIGLTISTLSSTTMQSLIVGFSLTIILITTSGLLTAFDAMPIFFQYVATLNPAYYGISGIWQIYLEGKSILDIYLLQVPLIFLSFLTLSIATYLFRHKIN